MHEAADTELFYPRPCRQDIDVLLIANGGRATSSAPSREYFLEQSLLFPHLRFCLYGVRHGEQARQQFRTAYRVDYRGWVPNAQTPPLYARSRLAMHLCREPVPGGVDGPHHAPLRGLCHPHLPGYAGPGRTPTASSRDGEHYLRAELRRRR